MKSSLSPLLILIISLASATSAGAQSIWRFEKSPSADETEIAVELDLELLHQKPAKLWASMPDGESLEFDLRYVESRGHDRFYWLGSADGGEQLSLTVEQGLVFARVETAEGFFSVQPRPFGTEHEHLLRTPKATSLGLDPCGTESPHSAAAPGFTANEREAQLLDSPESAAWKANPQIDVLVLYTPQARQAYGLSGVVGWAQRSMDLNNEAFIRSQMSARVRLVGVRQTQFQETGSGFDALSWLRTAQQPRTLRNEVGADVVGMIVLNAAQLCGVAATIPSGNIASFNDRMFQVTRISCIENHTFSHEMGHLFGMEHDPVNGRPQAAASFPWSYGHFVDGRFRTVMSYQTECNLGCTRRSHFSSPVVTFEGMPTGIAGSRDNRRTGQATLPIIANYRQPVSGEPPEAPSALQASAPSAFRVELTWNDNASNENSFEIQRASADEGNFSAVGTVAANTTTYVDETVDELTAYRYRVRAQNGFGQSAFTAEADVTTPAPDTSSCATDDEVVCLLGGRFEVRVSWRDFEENSGSGRVLEGFSDQSAIFWFFNKENWELMIKMVDACTFNDHYWIFSAATTNVEYTLEIRDTETGREKIYTNLLGTSAPAVTDTSALATCP